MSARVRACSALAATAVAYAGAGAVLRWATAGVLGEISRPGPAPVDATLGLAAAAGAWLLLSWLAATFVLAVLAAAAPRVRPAVRRVVDRVTPAATRRLAVAVLGAGLAGAPLGMSSPAWARDGVVGTDRVGELLPGWSADRPAPRPGPPATQPAVRSPHAGRPAPARTEIVVRAGDTLWEIAQRHLGVGAPASAVAAEWPRWHDANRVRIGPDPNLIRPGLRLRPPDPPASPSSATPRSHR